MVKHSQMVKFVGTLPRNCLCVFEQPLQGMELQEKEAQKDYSIQVVCLERTCSYKMSVNSRFKATKIMGQRKEFYRQRIPESSCAREKTVDIDILVTYLRMVTEK